MSAVRSSREAVNVIGESLEIRRTVEAVSGALRRSFQSWPVPANVTAETRRRRRRRRTVFKDCGIREQHRELLSLALTGSSFSDSFSSLLKYSLLRN